MESEPSPSEFPSISTPKFWNYLPISKDKQLLLDHFYKSLKKLTVKDVNDTMFGIILEQRKYYRDENINSLKNLKEKDDELKYEKQMNEILKEQKEDGINAINILQCEIKKYETKLFKAENALIKTKQESEEDAKATKKAITDAFKNELNELFDLREKLDILQRNSATLIEEKNAKNDEIERLRNASLKLIEENKVQNESNESLNIQIEKLQNDLKAAEKEIEVLNERKIAFNNILEMTKICEQKKDVKKNVLKAEYNDKIEKLEEEIRQLNAKSEAYKISWEKWAGKTDIFMKEKEIHIEKLKFELQKICKALQNQILLTDSVQKELNLLKSETQKLPNRKRQNISENKKACKKVLNQENCSILNANASKVIQQQLPQHLPPDIYFQQQQQYFLQQQNMSCQNPHLQKDISSRQPFQQIENIPSSYHPQQQQPQIPAQMSTSENGNPNFQQSFNSAQITLSQQQYWNQVYSHQKLPSFPSLF